MHNNPVSTVQTFWLPSCAALEEVTAHQYHRGDPDSSTSSAVLTHKNPSYCFDHVSDANGGGSVRVSYVTSSPNC